MNNNNFVENLIIKDAEIRYRNFSGRETQFNTKGNRNFCVFLDEEDANRLKADGWNVRTKPARDEDGPDEYYIQVTVNFNYHQPPKITMIKGKKGLNLNEDTVNELDFAEITRADLAIRPRKWEVAGKSGVKAYLHTARFEVTPDYFDEDNDGIIFD